jgi:Na+/H+ antiporter NhaD/arsenite permease-like protein
MIIRLILAAIAVAAVAIWPRSRVSAAVALAAGLLSALFSGWSVAADAVRATGPMLLFLTGAVSVAALAERRGLAERAALALARAARGRTIRLYALTCLVSTGLTFLVSLDGAVVLMVPLVLALRRRCSVAETPFFLGSVAVANAASLAVPEGNPTNLVVMSRLGLSPADFLGHLLLPGLCAALLCALVPLRLLAGRRYELATAAPVPARTEPFVPWRIGAQMAGLLASLDGLTPALSLHAGRFVPLLTVAGGTAAAAAAANNLPVSASIAALATSGPGVYAALIGLSVGALATAHGSVATLIARDLAGDQRPWARTWAPTAAAAVVLATLVLWLLN